MALAPIFKKEYKITQKYWNKLIINWKEYYKQFWLASHNWVDFATPIWTELLACVEWTITVKNDWKAGYWLRVAITKTRIDWITWVLYAHLSSTQLKTWDKVKVWDVIGKSGNSGGSTWPHLHFGLRLRDVKWNILNTNNWNKWRIDAIPYFQNWKYYL